MVRLVKFSTFQPLGPHFDTRLCRDLNICVNFFTTKHSLMAAWFAVGKISAFQPQGPRLDPQFCQDLNICVALFSSKTYTAFHPNIIKEYQRLVGANLRWISVPSRASQRLQKLEISADNNCH